MLTPLQQYYSNILPDYWNKPQAVHNAQIKRITFQKSNKIKEQNERNMIRFNKCMSREYMSNVNYFQL